MAILAIYSPNDKKNQRYNIGNFGNFGNFILIQKTKALMETHRFTLEKYDRTKRNRYTCPACGHKREFTRYIDTVGSFIFPEYVGKCNRINNCAYHYTPSEFFRSNPEALEELPNSSSSQSNTRAPQLSTFISKEISYIDKRIMNMSCAEHWYNFNTLFNYLTTKIGIQETARLFREYYIGTSKKWNGAATVFWYVSIDGKIRTGKIMLYHNNGHRVKEGYSRISWAHTELNLKNFNLELCFFGEHLLNQYPNKPVGIVESEKSAIICTAYIKDLVWIATGGKNGCLNSRYHILNGRKICLFPDTKAYDAWYIFYLKLKAENFSASISNLLEYQTSEEQWNSGIDIADILLKQPLQEATLNYFIHINPSLQLLIDVFELKLVNTNY